MTAGTTPVCATSVSTTGPPAARRGTDLILLATAGLLWGTGGLTGTLLGRTAGLPALSVAAYRLAAGGTLIVAYPLYFRGLRTARASLAALLALLEPLTGTVLAWLVLGDGLSATGIAGALILGAALVLAATARQPAPPSASRDRPAGDPGPPAS